MRSKFFVCTVLASVGFTVGVARTTLAADAKSKVKKGSSADASLESDKVISKQLQWEDKVMGPDDKRSELDKILKAQAINKAATEKAEREKEKADKEKAVREAKEAAAPKQQKRGGEVALPSLPDEDQGSSKGKKGSSTEISPKLDTAAAAAPPPPSKPADDKFIDKLLREEGGKKKKVTATNDDLLDLLSTEKKGAPKAKGGKKSEVDALLLDADKEPVAPAKKIQHETPEWQKPEIQSTPVVAAPPPPPKPAAPRNDGIIRVVQGAAGAGAGSHSAPVAARPAPAAMVPTTRRPAPPAAAPPPPRGGWDDPFADSSPRKKAAARNTRELEEEPAPAPRHNASAPPAPTKAVRGSARTARADEDMWEDPFDRKAAAARRAPAPAAKPAPARGGRWKDPFTAAEESAPAAKPSRGTVAMRDSGRESAKDEPSKWEAAARRGSDDSSESSGAQAGRWGVLKKRR